MTTTPETPGGKAAALVAIGCHVLPCYELDVPYFNKKTGAEDVHGRKSPRLPHGHLEASNDAAAVAKWWQRWPHALVGVAAGPSGLLCIDIDVDPVKGINGWASLDAAGLSDLPDTLHYKTSRGGDHYIYAAPEGIELDGQSNYRGLEGVDRRGGSSYFIWHADDVPTSRKAFR